RGNILLRKKLNSSLSFKLYLNRRETMADLKLLTERVVEKEKAAIRKSLEQAEIKAEDDLQAFEAEEVQSKQRKKEEIDKALKREYEIKRNTLSIQKRNDLLASKQNILNKVFADS